MKKNLWNKREIIINTVFSMIFSIAILFQTKINFTGKISQGLEENTFTNFELLDILKYLVIFILVLISIFIIQALVQKIRDKELIQEKENKELIRKRKIAYWCLYTAVIAVCYTIFLAIYYPGSVLADSFSSIYQITGLIELNNHFPILYTFFVGIFVKIGQSVNNYNIGIALYSITQIIIIAGILGYFLIWLKEKKVRNIYIVLILIYFIGNTIFATYAITMWKDPLFCAFLFLLMLRLYDIIETKGEILNKISVVVQFIILNILISFFRNNGIYIVIAIGLILAVMYWKSYKKFVVANIISIIIILLIQGPLYNKLGIKTPIEESFGIPIQQIAYTISVDGDINENDEKFLYEILPEEDWKNSYSPFLVDGIKWHEKFNAEFLTENKNEFLKVWLKTLGKNFTSYVKGYSLATYGFWSIETKNSYGFFDNYIYQNDYNIHKVDLLEKVTGIDLSNINSKTNFLGSGTLIWILMIVAMILIKNKESKYIICLLPSFILWASIMVATPVAFSLRYIFVLAYALPFIIILPIMRRKYEKSN